MARLEVLPPHDLAAERAVLGSMLISERAVATALERLRSADFYAVPHRQVFGVMRELRERQPPVPVDPLTLQHALRARSLLEPCGGMAYLGELTESTPTAAHIEHYARIVAQCSRRRSAIALAGEYTERAYAGEQEAEVLDEWLLGELLARRRLTTADPVRFRDVVQSVVERVRDRKPVVTLKTGLPSLDAVTGGFEPGDLVIVCARTRMGKTALLRQLADHCISGFGPAVYVSLEMSPESLATRALASVSGYPYRDIRDGATWVNGIPIPFSDDDIEALGLWADRLKDRAHDLWIDTRCRTMEQLRTAARSWVAQHGMKALFIDYVQLLRLERARNRVEEVGSIARDAKELAAELRVPVVMAAQASRAVEQRSWERKRKGASSGDLLRVSDLQWASELEQAANVILLINRHPDCPAPRLSLGKKDAVYPVLVDVAKARNDAGGAVRLTFDRPRFAFEEWSPREERDGMECELILGE